VIGLTTKWIQESNAAGNAYFQMSQTFQKETQQMVAEAQNMAEDFKHFYNFNEIAYAFIKTADSMERYGITGERYLKMVGRAAEIGAAKNLELKESIDRIESAIRGEAEASEYLGLTLNATYMKNQAFNGALKDTWEGLSDNEKAFQRYNELMQQSSKYAGATVDAVNTMSGAWSRLTNTLTDSVNNELLATNSALAKTINLLSDFIDLRNKMRSDYNERMTALELGLELPGNVPRSHRMPPPPPGGYSNKKPKFTTGGSFGGETPIVTAARGAASSKPAFVLPDSDPLAYWRSASGVSPDFNEGMMEAHQRALALISETTDAATVSYADMSAVELTWLNGAKSGLAEYNAAAMDTFQNAADAFGSSMGSMEDFLVDFTTTFKFEWQDLLQSIWADLSRLMIRQNITGPLAGLMQTGLGALFGGGGQPLSVTSGVSYNTAFGADGGVFSGPTSGYPAVMHGTEAIVPLSGGRSIPVEMKGGGTQVVINNNSGQQATVNETQTGDGMRQIMVTIGNDIRRMGPVGQAIGTRFGLSARGIA
jgi:hypothetical protein